MDNSHAQSIVPQLAEPTPSSEMPLSYYTIRYPPGISHQNILGVGVTAMVARLDAVIKFSPSGEDPMLERERLVYERLGHDHASILRYYGCMDTALILQYASHGSIRQYYASQIATVPVPLRLRWVEQIASAVAFVHSRGVLHGDISCDNVMLDEGLDAKLGDFAGSSMDGSDSLACYEASHEHPEMANTSIESEIFALGSTFFEVMTEHAPYQGLSESEIACAYLEEKFPNLASLAAFNEVIRKCWAREYISINELLDDVRTEVAAKSKLSVQDQSLALCRSAALPTTLGLILFLPIIFWVRSRR